MRSGCELDNRLQLSVCTRISIGIDTLTQAVESTQLYEQADTPPHCVFVGRMILDLKPLGLKHEFCFHLLFRLRDALMKTDG
jgi:hypothetical protein